MTAGQHRVVVWSTGGIGSIAIRAIHQRPNLDLVGVWVHSEDKVGKDAGELANGEPIGLATTNDADALIALKPDCVIYAASGPERDARRIPDYVKLLSAGINVVTTSTTRLVNPHAYEPAEWRDQLVAAAKEGQVVAVCLGHRAGVRRRLPAAGAVHAVVADREDPRLRDRPVRRLRRARHHERRIGIRPSPRLPAVDQLSRRDRRRMAGPDPDGRRRTRRRGSGSARDVRPRGDGADAGGRDGHGRGRTPAARCGCRRSVSSTGTRPSSSNTSPGWLPTSHPIGRRFPTPSATAW